MTLYHGSNMVVRKPEVRKTAYTKDFSWGFYCTKNYEQAARWARKNERNGVVNVYEYAESASLRIKKFPEMSCRKASQLRHRRRADG